MYTTIKLRNWKEHVGSRRKIADPQKFIGGFIFFKAILTNVGFDVVEIVLNFFSVPSMISKPQ